MDNKFKKITIFNYDLFFLLEISIKFSIYLE
jgi:hypothetical protein